MHSTKVMIIEDDTDIQEALTRALSLENCEINVVGNGAEALSELKSGVEPDLIFLDLMMPVMNGWEFLTARQKDPLLSKIPVIVLSAVANKDTSCGATDFLKKPVDLDTLLTKMHKFSRVGA